MVVEMHAEKLNVIHFTNISVSHFYQSNINVMFICKCNKFCFTFIQMCFVASQLFLQIPIHCLFLSRRLSKTNPTTIPGLNWSATWIVRYYGQSYRMPSESLKIYQVEFDLNLNFDTQKMFGLILLAL